MKKLFLIVGFLSMIVISCKKTDLIQDNPNNPGLNAIKEENGLIGFALGMWNKSVGVETNVPGEGATSDYYVAFHNKSTMGDETFIPWGNFGWRWVNQVSKITLPNGQVVNNPIGPVQKDQLQSTNSRSAGELNAFQYEWRGSYFTIGTSNVLLLSLNDPGLSLSGDAAAKKKTLKAWAYYWRGWAYSNIGSMYVAGLINNAVTTDIPNVYVGRDAIMAEATKNLDSAITELSGLSGNATYQEVMGKIVPSFCNQGGLITPANWTRIINTQKARNLLANKKAKSMTATDWTAVLALADLGMVKGDKAFSTGITTAQVNDLLSNFWHPAIMLSYNNNNGGWIFPSERLVQEYLPGDDRLDRNFEDVGVNIINPRNRGLQFGTRWANIDADLGGGEFTTFDNTANIANYVSCTWEENELMKAEVKINTGQINPGLGHIDVVRDAQTSGLAHVSGTGLTLAQAKEQLRRERRVGLFLRGTAWYDARRWSVNEAVSAGGGRTNAWVFVPSGFGGYTAPTLAATCTMEYNFLDYWDIPAFESDLNAPGTGSAPIKN
jgi:starch-binding outer membrane protein, SusD/RagB family